MRGTSVVVVCVVALLFSTMVLQAQAQVVLEAKGIGKIEGKEESKDSVAFLGLRYAQPPTGSLRWKAPQPFQYTAESVINATQISPICMQKINDLDDRNVVANEDCLFLNVFVPRSKVDDLNANQNTEPLPVMVFIHGGGFSLGSSADPFIKGQAFNERNAILVAFNYRLGPFGFLVHPALRQQDPDVFANFGLLDQKLALRWVRQNIASFGGNSSSITVFGESAGGKSIEWLLTSKNVDGSYEKLFDRTIIESASVGRALTVDHLLPLSRQVLVGSGWSDASTIDSVQAIEWLRKQPADTILNSVEDFFEHRTMFYHASAGALFAPVVDGKQFPSDPKVALEKGEHWFKNMDAVIGTTRDEGTLFVFMAFALKSITPDLLENGVRAAFNETIERDGKTVNIADLIMKKYENTVPLFPEENKEASAFEKNSEMINDLTFQCGTDKVARALSKDNRVFKYLFNQMGVATLQNLGVFHASELPFFFRASPGGIFLSSFTDEELAFSNMIIDQLVSFASSGSFTDAVSWPSYSIDHQATLVLEIPQTRTVLNYKHDICSFWDSILPHGPALRRVNTLEKEETLSWFFNALLLRTLIRNLRFVKPVFLGLSVIIVVLILRCCCFRKKSAKPVPAASKKQN